MGGFLEDYEIHVSKLVVKLWVAEGFLKPSVSKSFEERAEECLEDLVKRSVVLVTRRKSDGKIKSCNVHDVVRDLCIRKAREEKFLLNALDRHVNRFLPKGIKDQRRLSIPRSNVTLFSYIYSLVIRTAVYFERHRMFSSSFKSFRLLRILDALKVTVKEFPAEVLELFHLMYLAFSHREDRLNWEFYCHYNLVHLHQLGKLKISMGTWYWETRVPLWEKLAFPMMLKKLTLVGFVLSQQDMATVCSLPNLHVLKLINCSFGDCNWETSEGEFPQLKFLKIGRTNLKHWVTESSHFPSLERLVLHDCDELGEIPDVIGEIPTLELIEVKRWDKSLVDSAKRIKREQEDSGND
ncbi:putative late blight resistance proteinR1B-12 [Sesamum alatum]|uniref:Late blight resistance proteinR1B-12 n=1 Tax=Sesamum alatum TaxID=300844 RepID=A0AAE1YN48_9LAMI|nr:putative late blight resistance proteinR1B-12 [Sesamum alatum]